MLFLNQLNNSYLIYMVVINYMSPKKKEVKKSNAQILVKDYMNKDVITFFNYMLKKLIGYRDLFIKNN